MTYESALSEARQGCCDRWPKPCGYHEGYGDGYEHAERDTAAPEMLAALEHLLHVMDREREAEEIEMEFPDVVAAIAKAKGVTPTPASMNAAINGPLEGLLGHYRRNAMGWQSLDVELRALVKEWETKKHKIEKELESLHTAIRINQERGSGDDGGGRRASTYAQELTDAIHDALLSERPLHRMEILGKVAERGIHVGGSKPVNSIGSYLSTDQRFKNCGRGMWTLEHEPEEQSSLPAVASIDANDFPPFDDPDDLPF